jgi:hypothetical protein
VLESKAVHTSYAGIRLMITIKKPNGKQTSTTLDLTGVLKPGQRITFRKKFNDILSGKKDVSVSVQSAEVY